MGDMHFDFGHMIERLRRFYVISFGLRGSILIHLRSLKFLSECLESLLRSSSRSRYMCMSEEHRADIDALVRDDRCEENNIEEIHNLITNYARLHHKRR